MSRKRNVSNHSNNTLLLNAMTAEEYDEVEKTAKSDTSMLEETDYLAILNARLKKKQSFYCGV